MYTSRTIKTVLRFTIHNKKKTVEEIADEIGICANSLYKYALEGESGSEMPLGRLVPLMKATNNYELLKHIAFVCGFLTIRIPRMTADKKDEIDLVSEYQSRAIESTKLLKDFFNEPTTEKYELLNNSLIEVMELCAKNQKYAEKRVAGQLELL